MKHSEMEFFQSQWLNPTAEFRGAPFWSWNSKLEPAELRKQIADFDKMGLGGFFMHSRVGLATEYLGKDWFDCVKACIDEAKKRNMIAYMYDEDRWPSGSAGGLVTKEKKYRAHILHMLRLSPKEQAAKSLQNKTKFAAIFSGDKMVSYRKLKNNEQVKSNEELLIFWVCTEKPSSWYNGESYLDTMNPDAVKRFIEITHEKYAQEIGKEFGKNCPAIFTDEPNYPMYRTINNGKNQNEGEAPWTPKLAVAYKKKYNSDINDYLPEIFFNVKKQKFSTARYRFFEIVTELFVNAFTKQVGAWCEKHNIALTGHMLFEDSVLQQMQHIGEAMRHYEYMQNPGIDQLCERKDIYVTCKQLSSAAHQFGKKVRLSETYGCTGWDFPLLGHKALGDWQIALGINMRCPHLAWYSMKGQAKRDYPASISKHANYFDIYKQVEDYFARLNLLSKIGTEVRDLLVIHPIESAWGHFTFTSKRIDELFVTSSKSESYDYMLHSLTCELLSKTLDFDFGSEDIMERHAKAEKVNGIPVLKISQAEYRGILVPEMFTIRSSTLKLLKRFVALGGKVALASKNMPKYVDGVKSDEAIKFFKTLPCGIEYVEGAVRRVSVKDSANNFAPTVLTRFSEGIEMSALMICNTGMEKFASPGYSHRTRCFDRTKTYPEITITVETGKRGVWFETEPETGKIYAVNAKKTATGYKFNTSLDALQTRQFVLAPAELCANAKQRRNVTPIKQEKLNPAKWTFKRDDNNVLIFDHVDWCLGDGRWHNHEYILDIDRSVRKHFKEPIRGGVMFQPWTQLDKKHAKESFKLRCDFNVTSIPAGNVAIAFERLENLEFFLNGKPLKVTEKGFWVDQCRPKFVFPAKELKIGKNKLEIHMMYDCADTGLEYFYLLGEFGVKNDKIVTLSTSIKLGSWVNQGFSYYSGNAVYETDFDYSGENGVMLKLGKFRGAALQVRVNDKVVSVLPWAPFETDLTPYLLKGNNKIGIEVIGTRRNSHGPFYTQKTIQQLDWIGAGQFDKQYQGKRRLVPQGLFDVPELIYFDKKK